MPYETWTLDLPTLGPRTYLYHLEPVGIGTPFVESLTSYIGRLAAAHTVSLGSLTAKEFWPRVSSFQATGHHQENTGPYSTFLYEAHALNGIGRCAEQWVQMIESLTDQPKLRLLTALTWKLIISEQGLLRSKRAWCPLCFADWAGSGKTVYEPLLWALAAVSVCSRHGVPLIDVCPWCRRESGALSGRWRAGYCARCRKWLGSDRSCPDSGGEDGGYRRWVAENVGALLVRATSFHDPPPADVLRENLRACIFDLADGNRSALSRTVRLHESCFQDWLSQFVPAINSLMSVCFRLGFTLEGFLTERLSTEDSHWERARKIVRQSGFVNPRRSTQAEVRVALQKALSSASPPALDELALELGFRHATALRRRDPIMCCQISKRRAEIRARARSSTFFASPLLPKKRIIKRLESALAEASPPSLRAVAMELGYKYAASLYRWFPILCRRLVAKRREHAERRRRQIEAAFRAALTEEPAPTLKQVAHRLGYKAGRPYNRHFSPLFKRVAARVRSDLQQQKNKIRSVLEAALKEEPPPLMHTIARRVGLTRSYLTALFSDLWQRLGARSKVHRMQESARKREMLQQEAREITKQLLKSGTPPTRRMVQSMITRSPIKSSYLIDKEIRKAVEELQRHGQRACGH
jgi:plasmid stability protein